MKLRYYLAAAASVVIVHVTCLVRAEQRCCQHCGRCDGCEKVCRLVREDKKVNITCWGCQCEEFCAPGKSCLACRNSEHVCEECDPKIAARPKKFTWTEWEPGDVAKIYTKKKLMKKTVTKTVPSFKWVVEDICAACQMTVAQAIVPSDVSVPAPPRAAVARFIPGVLAEPASAEAKVVPVKETRSNYPWIFRAFFR